MSLATALDYKGQHSEAGELYKLCLDTMKVVFGESYPSTLSTMNNLASAYSSQGSQRS